MKDNNSQEQQVLLRLNKNHIIIAGHEGFSMKERPVIMVFMFFKGDVKGAMYF
jgi:hypothetical protein